MKMNKINLAVLALAACCLGIPSLKAENTAIAYRGSLTDSGAAVTGSFDLQFTLWDAATGGAVVGNPVTLNAATVSAGVFNASLDFGVGAFNGESRWLEIGAKAAGSIDSFEILGPRQALSPVPYALHALTAGTATSGGTSTDANANEVFVGADENSDEADSKLELGTDGIAHITILESGRVGIGKTPSAQFHVKQAATDRAQLVVENAAGDQTLKIDNNGRIGVRKIKAYSDFNIQGRTENASTHFRVSSVQDVTLFGVHPNGDATLAGTLTQNSDRRLKTDISRLDSVLEEVMELRPSSYRFKRNQDAPRKNLGFIAQEVEAVFPDVVDRRGEHLGLDYQAFGVLGIRAIQELKAQKDQEIKRLEQRNADLEMRLRHLEQLMSAKVSE